jgi:hypothetical protein
MAFYCCAPLLPLHQAKLRSGLVINSRAILRTVSIQASREDEGAGEGVMSQSGAAYDRATSASNSQVCQGLQLSGEAPPLLSAASNDGLFARYGHCLAERPCDISII